MQRLQIFFCTEPQNNKIPHAHSLVCMRRRDADPPPSCACGGLGRSVASMAALTFSLGVQRDQRVPAHQQTRRELKDGRGCVYELCSVWVSPLIPSVHVGACVSLAFSPADSDCGQTTACDSVESMTNISPLCLDGNIWPSHAWGRGEWGRTLSAWEPAHIVSGCVLGLSWQRDFDSRSGTGLQKQPRQ